MNTLPAFISNFTDRLGANLGTRAQPHVSIEGDRLTLVDGNGDTEPVLTRIEKGQAKGDEQAGDPCLECVIVDGGDHPSQIYYGRAYDPKAETYGPPACWSDNGVAPSTSCSEPQAASCTPDPTGQHGCKWAVWGSGRAREGSKVVPPACSKYQKLALMLPGDDIQFLLRVPPNSLVQLANYNAKFKGHPFSMVDVVTRVSIRDKTLHFTGVRNINDAEKAQRAEIWAAKKTDTLVGRGDKPRSVGKAPELGAPYGNDPYKQLTDPSPNATRSAPTVSLPASAPASDTVTVSSETGISPFAPEGTTVTPTPAAPVETQPDPLFAPSATPSGTTMAIPASVESTVAPPTRRRGRPPKETPATNPPTAGNGAAPQAPFPHGMTQAPVPNADLEASLKSVFG